MAFKHSKAHLRVDHEIFEVFRRNRTTRSYRALLSQLKVRTDARGGGVTRLHCSNIAQLDEPNHAPKTRPGRLLVTIEIPTSEEPLHRAYFTRLDQLSEFVAAS
ncbi:hypothetical protein ACIPX0_51265 [Streptomyces sp. NPDC090075]|uniref:hypothetical protein n=1 Tax=Streptomyces sp. NPDC090075 TaxID=3365937 RepID=UPI00380A5DAB